MADAVAVPALPERIAVLPYFSAEELRAELARVGEVHSRNGLRAVVDRHLVAGAIRQVDRGTYTARALPSAYASGRRFRPRPEGAHAALFACARDAVGGRPVALLDTDWLAPLGLGPPAGHAVLLLETPRGAVDALRARLADASLAPLRGAFPGHRLVVRPLPSCAPFDTARGIDHPCLERIAADACADMAVRNAEVYGPLDEAGYDAFLRRILPSYGLSLRLAARCARARRIGRPFAERLAACEGVELYCRDERPDRPVLSSAASARRRSMPSMDFGIMPERSTASSSVTSASSSMRMPMPHSGT